MADQVTVTSSKGLGSRLLESIRNVVIGLAMFVVSFPLLWWNEGRAVQTYKSLQEGQGAVVSVASDKVDPSREGKLVHVMGKAETTQTLKDPEFGVSAQALRLERHTEMYQWVESEHSETRKKTGGGEETVTTYSYSKDWRDERVDSSEFHESAGHENPATMRIGSESWRATPVSFGAFTLSDALVDRIDNDEKLAVTSDMLQPHAPAAPAQPPAAAPTTKHAKPAKGKHVAKAKVKGKGVAPKAAAAVSASTAAPTYKVSDGVIYLGADTATPAVGDERISFVKVPPTEVSIIAAQVGSSFSGYQTQAGDTLELLELGQKPAAAMFAQAAADNAMLTWILRVVGFVLMAIGLGLFFGPLAVAADVLPFLGDLLRMGIFVLALGIAVPLTLLTVAASWLYYRPLFGIALLVTGGLAFALVKVLAMKRRPATQPAAAEPAAS